jgi:histidine triad (HIT) family protein
MTLFTKIVNGEIPCYKVAEDHDHLAFLDINPLIKGHVLVIPKREENYIFDLSNDELARLIVFSKKVARAIKAVIPCVRVGVTVIGLEVPHAHIHLVPLNTMNDMNFSNEKIKLSQLEFEEIATSLSNAYSNID